MATSGGQLPMKELRGLVTDLYEPNPRIIWGDFGLSITIAHSLFLASIALTGWQSDPVWLRLGLQSLFCLISVIAYHRAAVFLHEIMHLPKDRFRLFRATWNVLCGVPMFIPSFTYYNHMEHHRGSIFGTKEDSEYVPLEYRSRWWLIGFWSMSIVMPIMFLARFYLMAPVGWMIPRLRRRFLRKRSTLVVDFDYERATPSKSEMKVITLQEVSCFLWCVGATVALCTFAKPWAVPFLVQLYAVAFIAAFINQFRALAVHRFYNDDGNMTQVEQILDTVNFPYRAWLTELWAPIGARFHVTHHIFPSIPYHNLPEAHRRLMDYLPEDSPYHQTNESSLIRALIDMYRRAGSRTEKPPADIVERPNLNQAA